MQGSEEPSYSNLQNQVLGFPNSSPNLDPQNSSLEYNSPANLDKDGSLEEIGTPNNSSTNVITSTESLLDILNDFGSLPEFISRCIFKEVVLALNAVHSQSKYHGNLTIETIFLTPNNEIVLSGLCLQDQEFNYGAFADMFCLGQILFTLVTGFLPFNSEEELKALKPLEIDWEAFWLSNEKIVDKAKNKGSFFNSDLRDIITSLLSMKFQPETLTQQINSHPWMKEASVALKNIRELLAEARKKMKK